MIDNLESDSSYTDHDIAILSPALAISAIGSTPCRKMRRSCPWSQMTQPGSFLETYRSKVVFAVRLKPFRSTTPGMNKVQNRTSCSVIVVFGRQILVLLFVDGSRRAPRASHASALRCLVLLGNMV